jgi:calcineurin-like phosphoesterase family protein
MREKVAFLASLAADLQSRLVEVDAEGMEDDPDFEGIGPIDQTDVDEMVENLRRMERDQTLWTPANDTWMPRDAYAAILQTLLDKFYRRNNRVRPDDSIFGEALTDDIPTALPNLQPDPVRGRFQLNMGDWRWLNLAKAKWIRRRRGPFPFVENTRGATPLGDNARVVLFGDWASGIPHAQKLAKTIWESYLQPVVGTRPLHAIHLGDAYYVGLTSDYQERFDPYWPVPVTQAGRVSSWTLAGNHDMYSGGYGFFRMLTTDYRFANQGGCSYFLLENENWQIFGLDTAYDPVDWKGDIGNLYGEQADWIARKRQQAPNKKCVLLTHHQPFSAYDNIDDRLERQLRTILEKRLVTTWFWGHEHNCALYEERFLVPYPIMLGHGGFPEKPTDPLPGSAPIELDWPFMTDRFLTFGFAVLDFDRDQIRVRLIDVNDTERRAFTIR